MVVNIDKNMKGYILNLFLIACFNLRSIIFFLLKMQLNQVIRLILEQVEGNFYY